ncbi:unnamed protein product [Trifolium pratense]|uniref:Uncharacterized protein n=1 Tax=Trifolium pratense TaxID=57577 RepID=A0ACB0J5X1_TRIPR|nr:unnamed protein product [Trifolium pratense]
MTFSPSLRFRKGVTNFLKICLIDFGMTCVGKELVKDAAKVAKEIISSSMTEIVCITQHHSIDISLKAIGFGPDRFMFARLEVDSSNVFFPQIRILSGESPRLCRQILHNSQDTFILYLTHSEKEHPNHSRNKREPSWQD